MRGRSIDELCRQFRETSQAAYYVVQSPERIAGQRLVWRGEVTRARTEITRLLALADEQGEPSAYALMRLHLCERWSCGLAGGIRLRGCSTNGRNRPRQRY
jgi:hypothetical protein